MDLAYIGTLILLILGFGFVVFWHELGHFIAAKWAGVKVEQFAVGFGQALLAWRKGVGVRVGSTQREYERRINEYLTEQERGQLELKERTEWTPEQIDRAQRTARHHPDVADREVELRSRVGIALQGRAPAAAQR